MKRRQRVRKGFLLISFFLFPATFYYLSPVLIIEASSHGIVNGSFIMFVLLFLSGLIIGRGFCGWACPAGGCQETIFVAQNSPVKRGDFIKWLIWVPWLATIMYFAYGAGGYSRIDFLYRTSYGLSIGNVQALIIYYLVLCVLIVIPAFLVGKRSFCHHLCWIAPFIISGRKIRNRLPLASLQLKAEPELCIQCSACTKQCPMCLEVEEMVEKDSMEQTECVLCGGCVDGCKQGAITFNWGKKPR